LSRIINLKKVVVASNMSDKKDTVIENVNAFRDNYKYSFPLFIATSILIAIAIVVISMAMYNSSGAAQLDLSRPGYSSVRSKATSSDDFKGFSSMGGLNQSVINNFKSLYNKQSDKIGSVDAFGGDPLSPDALGIGTTETIN
jgi:hypothetical protein